MRFIFAGIGHSGMILSVLVPSHMGHASQSLCGFRIVRDEVNLMTLIVAGLRSDHQPVKKSESPPSMGGVHQGRVE